MIPTSFFKNLLLICSVKGYFRLGLQSRQNTVCWTLRFKIRNAQSTGEQGCSEREMLGGSKEESQTAAWAKAKKRYGRLLSSRPSELPLLTDPARRRACFRAGKSRVPSVWKYQWNILAAARRLVSRRHPNVSQYQIFFWDIFAFYGLLEQLKPSPELKIIWKQRGKNNQSSSCTLSCICKQNVPRKLKMWEKLISLLTVEASEAFQVLYSFQLTQAGKVNNKAVAWKC